MAFKQSKTLINIKKIKQNKTKQDKTEEQVPKDMKDRLKQKLNM